MLAAVLGNAKIVDVLAKDRASLDIKNANGHTALMLAAAGEELNEDLQTIRNTLKDLVDQSAQKVGPADPLFDETETVVEGSAAKTGDESAMVKGKREDLMDSTKTVLTDNSAPEEIVETLVAAGASLESMDGNRRTALFLAAQSGDAEVVKILVGSGAKIDMMDSENKTILAAVKAAGHTEVEKILIATSLQEKAAQTSSREIQQIKQLAPSAEALAALEKPSAVVRNTTGQTPLILACAKNELDKVKTLIAEGAEVNAKDFNGLSSLMFACSAGNLEVVDFLLKHKADIAAKNVQGYTSMALAATAGRVEIVKKLIDAGASLDFKIKGVTLLMMVASRAPT